MKRVLLVVTIVLLFTALSAQPVHATLILHLDASDGSSVLNTSAVPAGDGDPVGTWVDLAGAPQNAVPSVGNPVYNINGGPLGQPVIDFSPPNCNLVTGAVSARTITMVHRWVNASSGTPSYLFDARAGIANSYVYQSGIGANWTVFVNDSLVSTGAVASIRSDVWQITTFVGSSAASDAIHLFSRYSNNEFGLGSLAEVRVFDTALTESERLAVVDELNTKWLTGPPPPNPPQLITPLSATSSTAGGPDPDLYPVIHLIDDSGLSGPATISNYNFVTHAGTGPTNSWVTDAFGGDYFANGGPPPVLEFILPDLIALTDVVAWNYSVQGNAAKTFDIEFSIDDALTFGTGIMGLIIPLQAGPAHTIPLPGGPYVANAVRITITDNYDPLVGGDRVGLAELKFIGLDPVVVPEPASASLALVGLAALALRRRRVA